MSTPEEGAVWELYRSAGLAETTTESERQRQDRTRAMRAAVAQLDDETVAGLRRRALDAMTVALNNRLDSHDERAALGSFPATTERYGVFVAGEPAAPPFVVRTLFIGRWNAIVGNELTEGMSDTELEAYWGWLALEAPDPPASLWVQAVTALDSIAPERAAEARAWQAFTEGDYAEAAAFYEALGEHSLRYRNYALAVLAQ